MAANQHILQSALESFWMSNYQEDRTGYARVLREVNAHLDPLLIALYNREPLLNFNHLNSTTFHQGKVRHVYEGYLCLKDFHSSENELSIEDGNSPTGFAFAKLSNMKSPMDEFCIISNSGKKFLSPRIISEQLLSHLRILLAENILVARSSELNIELVEHLVGNAIAIKLTSLQGISFEIHLIPTIPCSGRWTFGANAWLSDESYWPSKVMKHKVINNGIHLVGRSAPTKSPCQWQVSFMEPMKMLLDDTMSTCRDKCLEIMKLIVNRSQVLQKGVTVFLLETMILDLYKKYPQVSFWREDRLTQRFVDFVEVLRQAIQARKCHDFFLFDLNLLKDMDQSTANLCEQHLGKLLDDPEGFFRDLKSRGAEDTHL